MNEYKLKVVRWETGEGAMAETVGWELDNDGVLMTLAGHLEQVSNADYVPAAFTEVPVANIHSEEILEFRRTA